MSIDLLSHKLAQVINKYNHKLNDRRRRGMSLHDYIDSNSNEDLTSMDSDKSVVRSKRFAMQPISVDEAVYALSFIDHDFYVFRNQVCSVIMLLVI